MTTPEQPGGKRKAAARTARVKRPVPARSGPIRTGAQLPATAPAPQAKQGAPKKRKSAPREGQPASLSSQVSADIQLEEIIINEAVANAIRTANKVLADTVAQGRLAAELFRQGDYNMQDVPVDLEILGKRVLKLTRELGDTTLNILEQLLKKATQTPTTPPAGLKGSVPPFPAGKNTASAGANQAPPSSHAAPPPPGNGLDLIVQFAGTVKARALPSPLWKPSRPTLPKQLSITPMLHMAGTAAPITVVTFEADLTGKLIATVTVPDKQPPGIYSGMIVPDNADAPLGVLTIEIVA